jgi:hypothetical protein
VRYHTESGSSLPYDPFTTHAIGVAELEACAQKQGVTFREGDVLLIRAGFMQKFNSVNNEARAALGSKEETLSVFLTVLSRQCRLTSLLLVLGLSSRRI